MSNAELMQMVSIQGRQCRSTTAKYLHQDRARRSEPSSEKISLSDREVLGGKTYTGQAIRKHQLFGHGRSYVVMRSTVFATHNNQWLDASCEKNCHTRINSV